METCEKSLLYTKSKKKNKIEKVKQKKTTYTYMHKYIDSRYMFTYAFVCVYILYTILIYIAYFSVLFETKRKAKENSVNRINNVEVKKTLFLTK